MRLCLALGFPTRRALLEKMDARDLAEWQAFQLIDGPIGGRRHDVLATIQAAAATAPWRKKTDKAPEVFEWWSPKPEEIELSEDELEERRLELLRKMGGANGNDR
jgi:hypothetical protein